MSPFIQPSICDHPSFPIITFLRQWLDLIEIDNARTAHIICKLIPSTCPFERNVSLFHHTFHSPALCKFNPLYNELVALRFRALSYLSDRCEDITPYFS